MLFAAALLLAASCSRPVDPPDDFQAGTILTLERGALDVWGHGDPRGYLDLYAQNVSYFDPVTEKRVDGLEAMRAYYAPLMGKIHVDRYEMKNVNVQHHGDVAVLSYNLVNYGASFDGKAEAAPHPWNSTKVYVKIDGRWKIVHDHWSYVKPELK